MIQLSLFSEYLTMVVFIVYHVQKMGQLQSGTLRTDITQAFLENLPKNVA